MGTAMRFLAASALLASVTTSDEVNAAPFFKSSLSSSTITHKYGLDITSTNNPISKRNGWFSSFDLRGGAIEIEEEELTKKTRKRKKKKKKKKKRVKTQAKKKKKKKKK